MTAKIAGITVLAAFGGLVAAGPASSHGHVSGPIEDRGQLCFAHRDGGALNKDCGPIEYEPWSLEAPKGFPAAGPADGHISSAGGGGYGDTFKKLDEQSPTRWEKNDIKTGPNEMKWYYNAPHATSGWTYYMTKPGWDQNSPLKRSELEQIGKVDHDGSNATTKGYSHFITVPEDRSGYHLILSVWDVADTPNAFYSTSDVNVTGSEGQPEVVAPSAPTKLATEDVAASSLRLNWTPPVTGAGAKDYTIFRDGTEVGTSDSPSYTDAGLSSDTSYQYTVKARGTTGLYSAESAPITVRTAPAPEKDVTPPTAPTNLHSMKVTDQLVDLMWKASTDDVGVANYMIFRDGVQIGTTKNTKYPDTSVAPDTKYEYTIKAADAVGNLSEASNVLTVTTKAPTPGTYPTWNAFGTYQVGDQITHNGANYVNIQSYTGHGDSRWIDAPTLWKLI